MKGMQVIIIEAIIQRNDILLDKKVPLLFLKGGLLSTMARGIIKQSDLLLCDQEGGTRIKVVFI